MTESRVRTAIPTPAVMQRLWHGVLCLLVMCGLVLPTMPVSSQEKPGKESCIPERLEYPRNPDDYPCTEGPQGSAVVKWRTDFPDEDAVSVWKSDDQLFVKGDTTLYSVDNDTGEIQWEAEYRYPHTYTDASWRYTMENQYILISVSDRARLIDRSTGEILWETPPTTCDDCEESDLVAWLNDGVLITQRREDRSPVLSHFVFQFIDVANDTQLWTLTTNQEPDIFVSDGLVFFLPRTPTREAELQAYDLYTGENIWVHEIEQSREFGFAIQGDTILLQALTSGEVYLYALNAKTGSLLWDAVIENIDYAVTPTLKDDHAIAVTFVDKPVPVKMFHFFDSISGEKQSDFTEQDPNRISMITPDIMYTVRVTNASDDPWIRAYSISDGTELWRAASGVPALGLRGRVLVYDGTLYFRSKNEEDKNSVASMNINNGQVTQNELSYCSNEGYWGTSLHASKAGVLCGSSYPERYTPSTVWTVEPRADHGSLLTTRPATPGDWQSTMFYESDGELSFITLDDGIMYLEENNDSHISVVAIGGDEGPQAIKQHHGSPGQGIKAGESAIITGNDAILRGAPSDTSVELDQLNVGDTVTVLAGPIDEGQGVWWQVQTNDGATTGFLPAANLVVLLE